MGSIVTAMFAASRASLFWLFRMRAAGHRRNPDSSQLRSRQTQAFTIDTLFGEPGLVMTPAQRAAFATRSFTWRCISCGKVHALRPAGSRWRRLAVLMPADRVRNRRPAASDPPRAVARSVGIRGPMELPEGA